MVFDHIIFYRLGQFLALCLPQKIAYRLAVLISDLRYLVARQDRKNVTANLKTIFPQKSPSEIAQIRIELFRNFAKYLVDFFRLSKSDSDFVNKSIRIENLHYIDEALSKGKGVIILSAHIGNWELGGVSMGMKGYPISTVALPHKDRRVDNFFNFRRTGNRMKVIPLGRAVRQCLSALMNNELIALAGDRNFGERGLIIEFFGKQTSFPEGPAIFSLKIGSLIVPGFTIRNKDDSLTLRFEHSIEFKPTGNQENDVRELILKYKTIIEDYIRRYPQQWFMFRKFWVQ